MSISPRATRWLALAVVVPAALHPAACNDDGDQRCPESLLDLNCTDPCVQVGLTNDPEFPCVPLLSVTNDCTDPVYLPSFSESTSDPFDTVVEVHERITWFIPSRFRTVEGDAWIYSIPARVDTQDISISFRLE